MFKPTSLLLALVGMLAFPLIAGAIDTRDTRMLSQPAVSADHIAFIYAEDLWVANADGSDPRRLTVSEGIESNPVFSPDGKWIAFSAQYDGNVSPDIEVEQNPADVIKGHDPQLEKAIQVALQQLGEHPVTEPVRPPFPVEGKN